MKKILCLISFLILSMTVVGLWGATIKPDSYSRKEYLETGETSYIYYSLTSREPLEAKLRGPFRIKVYIRVLKEDQNAQFSVAIDGAPIKNGNIEKAISRSNKFRNYKSDVTTAEVFYVKVPEGEHTLSISTEKDKRLFTRLVKLPEEKVHFAPSDYKQALNLIVNEKEYTYFLCDREYPVELTLIGPTTLEVFARLNYYDNMTGSQHFTIIVEKDNQPSYNLKLETIPSELSYYKEDKGILPSKAEKFEIKLDKGTHTYHFYLGDTAASTAGLRFFVPKSALTR
ncbi:hypothetical protein JW877_02185 [bacterium]|nr:hypothetical protein [bacterium]